MEKRVVIDQWQKVTTEDFNNLGEFPRQSFDHVVDDCGPGWGFTGFACAQTSTTVVTVGAGRLYDDDGKVYLNEDAGGVQLDFLSHLPVVTKRIATIVVWGQEILTDTEPRTFITDTQTRATEARAKSTESRRHCNIQAVYGVESPDPQRPTIASNVLAIAYVMLGTTGVESIQMEEDNRVRSLADHDTDIANINLWRELVGTMLETLASELAALSARIHNLTPLDTFLRSVADITRLKEKADLPDTYSAWAADYFLDDAESDTLNVDYLARIEEGIRFPHAAERVATLALLNPIDSTVNVTDNFLLPAYTEIRRLGNVAIAKTNTIYRTNYYTYRIPVIEVKEWRNHLYYSTEWRVVRGSYTTTTTVTTPPDEISISQYATQSLPYYRYHRVRWRCRWGAPYYWSSRISFWWDRRHDPVYWTFRRRSGDTYFIALDGPPYATVVYAPAMFRWQYKWHRSRWFWRDWVRD